ncbi:hypothetical protein HDU88_003144 [Geranomyces variabilis]|nr:hypothetical protein HDU88_003144 [Geranomyces variabilis]
MSDHTHSQEEFYSALRENTVVMLVGLPLLGIAAAVLRRYRFQPTIAKPARPPNSRRAPAGLSSSETSLHNNERLNQTVESDQDVDADEELQGASAAALFCSIALASALGGFLLLQVTSIFRELVAPSLVERFWHYSFISSSISLYGLMPLAYLFLEANSTTWFAKFKESLQVASLLWTLEIGLVYILTRLFGVEVFMESHPWLSALNIVTSLPCGLLCGLATPRGAAALFRSVSSVALPLDHRKQISLLITERDFEIMSLENRQHVLQSTAKASKKQSAAHAHSVDEELAAANQRILTLQCEIKQLKAVREQNPIARGFMIFTLLALELLGWVAVMVRITASLADHVLGANVRPWNAGTSPPAWWRTSEYVALAFFSVSTTVGFYQLIPQLRLRPHKTPSRHMVGNIVLLLLVSMSLPLICRSLGIATLAYGPYAELPLFKNHPWAMSVYKAVTLWLLGPARTLA